MTIKQTIEAERNRGRRIMHAAVKAGLTPLGLSFLERGRPAAEFERVCDSLAGKPGTFGHMAGITAERSADQINAELFRRGPNASQLAAMVIAAGAKAGAAGGDVQ